MSSPAGWSTSSLSKAALSVFACLLVLAAACGGDDDNKGIAISTQAPSRVATPETRTPIGVPPVQPTSAPTAAAVGGEAVAFQTQDGKLTLRGTLFSAPGPKRRAVVMVAFPTSTEADLQPFARELAGAGIAALTFQLPVYEGRDFALADKDVETAVSLLEARDYPQIYVIGDGPAAVALVRMAARHKVAGVIGLITNTGSISAQADMAKVAAPKLLIAGQDPAARTMLRNYMQAAPEPKQSKTFDGAAAGAKLLSGPDAVAVKQLIRDFLLK